LTVVRFEGVEAGAATITVSDVVVRDAAGAAIPLTASSATTQVVVMSGPI
jgi:hypothetical protein